MTIRAIKALCIASLALNVFLAGAIGGGVYRWFAAHRTAEAAAGTPAAARHALRFAAQDLSPERQRQFADALRQARREVRPFARQAREDRGEVLRRVAAPQFDRPALDAALANTREADRAVRERLEAAVADFVAALTPAERATFAQSLQRHGQWRQPQRPAIAQGAPSEASDAR